MKRIVVLIGLLVTGCAITEPSDTGIILDEISVTQKLFIPGLNMYCEIDEDGFIYETCSPETVYAESEEDI